MKLSGPQKNLRMPTCAEIGILDIVFSRNGPIRSQSGGSSPKEKSAGMPSTFHGRADRLEHAEHQAAALLAEVAVVGRVLQHRPVPAHLGDRLGEQVVVLGRLQRDADAGQLAELARPHARAVDHVLGLDVAVRGPDAGHRAVAGSGQPVTGTPSMILAPCWRAPLASDMVTSTGFTRPSAGM